MTLSAWLSLALVCLLGAMSPGPSLAIVVRHSVTGGTRAGVICALSHGFGIFLWAALMVSGLGALLLAQPTWFDGLRALGAGFLLYLGCRALMAQRGASANTEEANRDGGKAAREGLVMALSNPKVAVFFAAIRRLMNRRVAARSIITLHRYAPSSPIGKSYLKSTSRQAAVIKRD